MNKYLQLIRVHQWYKNGLIFLPLIFVNELLHLELLINIIYGFAALCLISSAGYILNDIIDRDKDKHHPEKKFRPIASGRVSAGFASFVGIIFAAGSFALSYWLNIYFFVCVLALAISHQLYSFWLKNEAIADVIVIGVNFVIRSISGAFIIAVSVSPWLVLCPFFLAIMLAIAKRESEMRVLGKTAAKHKASLKYYNFDITKSLMIISTTMLILVYSIYCVSKNNLLLVSLPFAVYAIMRYYFVSQTDPVIGQNAEKIYTDTNTVIAVILWGLSIIIVLYLL